MPYFTFGNNNLNAKDIFKERDLYDKNAYPDEIGPRPIDIWDNKYLHGRVDEDRDSVYIVERNLKQINSTSGETYFALNFVVDAFNDFRDYIYAGIQSGKVPGFTEETPQPAEPYVLLDPQRAWTSVDVKYEQKMDQLYIEFATYLENTKLSRNVLDYKTFESEFFNFLLTTVAENPITRSSFIVSNENSPLSGGLIIEIMKGDHSDDFKKLADYIYNKNFEFFRNSAARFGFAVDKNAPWRLVADIRSEQIKPYLQEYGVNDPEGIFKKYYAKSYLTDMFILKNLFFVFYNTYVAAIPQFSTPKENTSAVKKNKRQRITKEEFAKVTSDEHWMKMYVSIRALEINCDLDKKEKSEILNQGIILKKYLDSPTAMRYINSALRKCSQTRKVKG